MSKTMEAMQMLNRAFESQDGRPVPHATISAADYRLLVQALMEGPRYTGQFERPHDDPPSLRKRCTSCDRLFMPEQLKRWRGKCPTCATRVRASA